MSDELPKGWASARLEEIVTKKKGKKPDVLRDSPADGFVPYLDIHAIERNVVRQFAEVKSSKLAAKDDLFVVWDGARSGWIGGGITGAIGSTIMALTAQQAESRYVRHFIASQFQTLNNNTRGTGIPHVDPEVFWNLEVPLAPLGEQRRIVVKLETLLGKVDASQQRLAEIPVLLKRFRQSVLAAACSGRLTADWREENPDTEPASTLLERIASQFGQQLITCDVNELPFDIPSSWESIQASDLCRPRKIITYGVLKPVWVKGGVPTVRVKDMKQGQILVDQVAQCCPERAKKFSKTTLEAGDLLIAKDGATLGKTAFVPPELAGGNITQHVLRFPISHLVESVFVRLIIDSRHGQEWMRTETRGAALPGVNVGDFRRMPIPLPPLAEQQEIVRRVEGLFALADQLEERLAKARGQVEKLTPSLLARAFAGQLVPQDPTDEPAEKLLERIKAGKE